MSSDARAALAAYRISPSAYPGPPRTWFVQWENMERLRAVRWKRTVIEVLSDACQMYVHGCLPLPMLRA